MGEFYEKIKADTPLGRVGAPDDYGAVAVFLASDDSHWVVTDLVESGRTQRLTALLKQPPCNFVLAYTQLATYGTDKDHPRLGPNTIAAAKRIADICKGPSF